MRWLISMVLLLLQGCADLGYYWHSASGHLAVMSERVEIDDLLADESLEADLRDRLRLLQQMRRFSVDRLALPDNDSYHSYVQLNRPYVLQNLFAAPEFSTRLHRWCYPIIGCTSYRGYYDEARLRDYVEQLEAEGYEIYVGQVPAYSTLGWFDDPVLSSFIHWPEYRLAGLLFHELTHQRIYIDDDTTFNESLATAVQVVGTELWLDSRGRRAEIERMQRWLAYRADVVAIITATREDLAAVYARPIGDEDKRMLKAAAFAAARAEHAAIAARHGVEGGYTGFFEDGLNNAKLGSIATYNAHVDAFVNMIAMHDFDFAAFFAYAEEVGALDPVARQDCLERWQIISADRFEACPDIGESK